jgi:hypothetical protein
MFHAGVSRILLAAAAVALLVGCGSAENEPPLAEAAQKTVETGTSRIAARSVGTGGERRPETCAGAADYGAERVHLTCGGADFVVVDDVAYVRGEGLGFLGAEGRWVRLPQGSDGSVDRISPIGMLSWLRSASRETERVGETEVRGEHAVVYRLTVVCDEVDLECESETAPVEVAVGDDGLVRRVHAVDRDTEMTIEFFDFGTDVSIEPPPPAEVVDVDNFEPKACRGGGDPIDAEMAIGALRRGGFAVERDDECIGAVVAALGGAYAGSGTGAAFFMCSLADSAPEGASGMSVTSSATGTQMRLANLTCNLYGVGGGGPSDENVDRLEGAFEDLARQIRP